jgi:uncharacterized surface protein with fasciclin (FAS1) repeats
MRRIALGLLAGVLVAGMIAAPVAARRAGPSIVDTAVAANSDPSSPLYQQLDTLISLVTTYGLAGTLDGNRQFTVFAPTDAAFAELFAQVDPSTLTAEQIRSVLKYHVLPGRKDSGAVVSSDTLKTLNGQRLDVTVNADGAFVNQAEITVVDIRTSNGIIHVIDAVLVPNL